MAWGSIGTLSTVAYSGNNQTNMVHTLGANPIAPGNFAVIAFAQDNASSVSNIDGVVVTTVGDSAGNVWLKAKEWQTGGGAAQGGAVCSVWYTNAIAAVSSGTGTITATLDSSQTANFDSGASAGWVFSVGGAVYALNSTAVISATSAPGAIDLNSGATGPYMRFRGIASESTLATAATTSAGWTAIGTARASATKAMGVRGEWIITASSTANSAPGVVGSAAIDQASVYVIFAETAPAVGAAAGDSETAAYAGAIVAMSVGAAQGDSAAGATLTADARSPGETIGDAIALAGGMADSYALGSASGDSTVFGFLEGLAIFDGLAGGDADASADSTFAVAASDNGAGLSVGDADASAEGFGDAPLEGIAVGDAEAQAQLVANAFLEGFAYGDADASAEGQAVQIILSDGFSVGDSEASAEGRLVGPTIEAVGQAVGSKYVSWGTSQVLRYRYRSRTVVGP